jgi:hypothetical protein
VSVGSGVFVIVGTRVGVDVAVSEGRGVLVAVGDGDGVSEGRGVLVAVGDRDGEAEGLEVGRAVEDRIPTDTPGTRVEIGGVDDAAHETIQSTTGRARAQT